MKTHRKILIVLHDLHEVLEGIANYNQMDQWLLRIIDHQHDIHKAIKSWQPDGVIYHHTIWKKAPRLSVPMVEVLNPNPEKNSFSIDIDNKECGRLAAEFFLDKGFLDLAFITGAMRDRSIQQFTGLNNTAEARDRNLLWFEHKCEQGMVPSHQLQTNTLRLGKWLKQQPRPLGVLTINDYHALHVLEACRQMDLRVPEDISVLGTGNDPHLCAIAHPSLSSIRFSYRQIGFEAARLLDARLKNRTPVRQHFRIAPIEIIERNSTNAMAINDPAVLKALIFINEHCGEPTRVSEVVRHSGVSRSLLQFKFQRVLQRSPLEEIHRQKMEAAKKLLRTTTLTMEEIAGHCGLTDQAQFTKLFKKMTSVTPSAFRREFSIFQ
ncbi:MAG: substrate-binding domain-containing protein [Kiritimatiellales bacterium]